LNDYLNPYLLIERLVNQMILTLSSTNPDLSYVIKKNPNGLPVVRPLRDGYLFGWYPKTEDGIINPQLYVIYFYDSPEACSFQMAGKGNETKYVNGGQYCSPLIITGAQTEILSSALQKKDEHDVSHTHTLTISGFWIKNMHIFQALLETFQEIRADLKPIVGEMFQLEMNYHGSLYDFMSIISLISILTALSNGESIRINDMAIEKYAKLLDRSTTGKVAYDGWYLRYIFKKRTHTTKKYLHLLNTPRIQMTCGNTTDARCEFISENLPNFNMDFLDIGCGPDLPVQRMIHRQWNDKSLSKHEYHLVDSDPKIRDRLVNRGFLCYESIHEFYDRNPDFDGCIIMTEVVEHNTEEDAARIVQYAISHHPALIFISTPNFAFNQFFISNTRLKASSSSSETVVKQYRHDDHQWEMTFEEFQIWLSKVAADTPYDIQFMGIGDSVDGIPITSGAILTRRK
jgi:2-polyprenyl-3-methyl-5-hydroxy-6-metoxy-1,4-benzoquinol methylase